MNVNVNLMEQNVSQITVGMTINVDVSVRSNIYPKKIMFGILLLVAVKMEKNLASIMDDSAFICDEVMKSYREIKTISTLINEKI